MTAPAPAARLPRHWVVEYLTGGQWMFDLVVVLGFVGTLALAAQFGWAIAGTLPALLIASAVGVFVGGTHESARAGTVAAFMVLVFGVALVFAAATLVNDGLGAVL